MQPNRWMPRLPVGAVKTYEIRSPLATHWRTVTCAEDDCPNRAHGWRTALDTSRPEHAEAANWIRLHSGRSFTVEEAGPLVTFTFPPGQNCFTRHRQPLDRPEFYRVVGGDWRGNPRGDVRQHANGADWQDDFANHQDKLATRFKEG